jgi:hypothetical protein
VATDPAGDRIVGDVVDEKHAPDQKNVSGTFTITTATGKFAGMSGGGPFVEHGTDFRTAAEGTYVSYNTFEGNYKLP